MSWLFPFLNFLQPGVLFPALADYRPMLVVSLLCLVAGYARHAEFSRRGSFASPIFWALCAFIAIQALSVHFAGMAIMFNELVFWCMYWLFVVVSVLLISSAQDLRRYIWGMIVGGMVIVIAGILSVPFKWGLAADTGRAGAWGMYQNHNDYTFIIVQILPFVYMYSRIETGWRRSLLRLCVMACIVGNFMSLSRGGVLAIVLEFLLIVLMGMQGKRRFWLLPLVALAGMAAIGYQWAKRAENQQTGYTAETAEESREELWRAARIMVQAKPFLGVGSRRFGEFARDYYDLSKNQIGKNSHDTYLEVLATSGFLGFGLFAFMLAGVWRQLRRPLPGTGPPVLEATRLAGLISLYSILFRGILDAKSEDWSIYVLLTVGIAYAGIRAVQSSQTSEASLEAPQPAAMAAAPRAPLAVDVTERARLSHQIFKG
jgi:O-antigen ligase